MKNKGLIAAKVYIRGIPTTMVIDDYFPVTKATADSDGGDLVFAAKTKDGAMFGPIFEKLWAKATANYELIGTGG
jgi:hypothetical protein